MKKKSFMLFFMLMMISIIFVYVNYSLNIHENYIKNKINYLNIDKQLMITGILKESLDNFKDVKEDDLFSEKNDVVSIPLENDNLKENYYISLYLQKSLLNINLIKEDKYKEVFSYFLNSRIQSSSDFISKFDGIDYINKKIFNEKKIEYYLETEDENIFKVDFENVITYNNMTIATKTLTQELVNILFNDNGEQRNTQIYLNRYNFKDLELTKYEKEIVNDFILTNSTVDNIELKSLITNKIDKKEMKSYTINYNLKNKRITKIYE